MGVGSALGRHRRWMFAAIGTLGFAVSACSTPEEKVADFTESGNELLEEGNFEKAAIQFRNALLINVDYVPALRGLLAIREYQKNEEQILSTLVKITDLDKSDVPSRVQLAKLYLLYGSIDKAVDYINEALALAPEDPEAMVISAGIQLQLDDTAGAIERAQKGLAADPTLVDGYAVLAAERVRAEDIQGAIAILEEGIEKAEDTSSLRLIKVQMLTQLNDIDEAIAVYDALVKLEPDDLDLGRNFAFFLAQTGRLDDARERMQIVVDAAPENDDYVLDLVRIVNTKDGPLEAESLLSDIIEADSERYGLRRFLAELQLSRGAADEGRKTLLAISEDAPDTEAGLEAKSRAAELSLRAGNRAEAETLIEDVLSIDDKVASARVLKATLAVEDGDLDGAISMLRGVLADAPNSVPALMLLGQAHTLNGAKDLALDRYEQAFSASEGRAEVALAYANVLMNNESYDQAENVLSILLRRSPTNLKAWRLIADLRLRRKDWVGAQEAANRIETLDDASFASEVRGAAATGLQNMDDSIAAFQAAYDESPANARPLVKLISAYQRAGRTEEAKTFLERQIANNPDGSLARILLAQIYGASGDRETARSMLLDARKRAPEDILVHRSLYTFHAAAGEDALADEAFEEGLKRLPNDISLRLVKAGKQEREKDFEGAIETYEGLLKDVPNAPIVVNNLASLLSDHRDDTDSLRRALELAKRLRDSKIPQFKDTYGWASYRIGQVRTAIDVFEDIVEQAPDIAVFRYHLGVAYAADGQIDAARDELEAALEVWDENGGIDQKTVETALKDLG